MCVHVCIFLPDNLSGSQSASFVLIPSLLEGRLSPLKDLMGKEAGMKTQLCRISSKGTGDIPP